MGQQQGKVLLLGNCLLSSEYAIFSFWTKTNGVEHLCVNNFSVYLHLLYFPEKTNCSLRLITRSWSEEIVLLFNWNYLGSWPLGTKVIQMQDLLLRGQESLLRHRSECSPVGASPGKLSQRHSIPNFFLLSNTPYSQFLLFLSFFPHSCLVGWFCFVYLHLLGP